MNIMARAAFGDDPGRWPLPAARTPLEHWQRAVAAGGQGRYAAGFAELDHLARAAGSDRLASLALSTRASFLRQLGRHDEARPWDGRALARAGADDEAAADALIGLAADALGVGRFAASARLLRRAGEVVVGVAAARLPVRLGWVSAELAMFTGDGRGAVGHAERAVALSPSTGSVRHAVKSDVVLAAALCSVGDLPGARRVADEALAAAEGHGLVPLSWALTCLLADIGSAVHPPAVIASKRAEFADTVGRRGGAWADR